MPWGLKRFQECRNVHFLTFSCYRRKQNLASATACSTFLDALERVREQYLDGWLTFSRFPCPEILVEGAPPFTIFDGWVHTDIPTGRVIQSPISV